MKKPGKHIPYITYLLYRHPKLLQISKHTPTQASKSPGKGLPEGLLGPRRRIPRDTGGRGVVASVHGRGRECAATQVGFWKGMERQGKERKGKER